MKTGTLIDFSKLPSRAVAYRFADELYDFLFPNEFNASFNEALREEKTEKIKRLLQQLLEPLQGQLQVEARETGNLFFSQLPVIYEELLIDADLFVASDPAATGIEEVIIAYPGFYTIAIYRVAHLFYKLKVPVVPRLLTEYAHSKTGIDIHPDAVIGNPFFIDHGTGVVIGQTATVGKNVKIYQGVTLGALAVRAETRGNKRHPTIEDNVVIYAGSCILGGNTVIGHDSIIGGNVWLTQTVPPYSVVYQKSDVRIRDRSEMNEIIDFII